MLDGEPDQGRRAITLLPDQAPSPASVTHVISVSSDGSNFTNVRTLNQVMATGTTYPIDLGQTFNARYVRITTAASPSWVAWWATASTRTATACRGPASTSKQTLQARSR